VRGRGGKRKGKVSTVRGGGGTFRNVAEGWIAVGETNENTDLDEKKSRRVELLKGQGLGGLNARSEFNLFLVSDSRKKTFERALFEKGEKQTLLDNRDRIPY